MYNFHSSKSNPEGEPRGWLRTMWYGVTQQVIQSDLGYWLLHFACRLDRNPQLVSCPWPAITNRVVSAALSRQIPLDIDQFLASGKGGNVLQGSVAMDDESQTGGMTEYLPGFQHNLSRWWELIGSEPRPPPTYGIQKIGHLYEREHERVYGPFEQSVCDRGEV